MPVCVCVHVCDVIECVCVLQTNVDELRAMFPDEPPYVIDVLLVVMPLCAM
jgi:hypothetical protein